MSNNALDEFVTHVQQYAATVPWRDLDSTVRWCRLYYGRLFQEAIKDPRVLDYGVHKLPDGSYMTVHKNKHAPPSLKTISKKVANIKPARRWDWWSTL